jgi:hypothetical protein
MVKIAGKENKTTCQPKMMKQLTILRNIVKSKCWFNPLTQDTILCESMLTILVFVKSCENVAKLLTIQIFE